MSARGKYGFHRKDRYTNAPAEVVVRDAVSGAMSMVENVATRMLPEDRAEYWQALAAACEGRARGGTAAEAAA